MKKPLTWENVYHELVTYRFSAKCFDALEMDYDNDNIMIIGIKYYEKDGKVNWFDMKSRLYDYDEVAKFILKHFTSNDEPPFDDLETFTKVFKEGDPEFIALFEQDFKRNYEDPNCSIDSNDSE